MIRYSRIKFDDTTFFLDGSWNLSGISPITRLSQ